MFLGWAMKQICGETAGKPYVLGCALRRQPIRVVGQTSHDFLPSSMEEIQSIIDPEALN